MNLVAIICEFNPLHKGHALLIKEAKRLTGADGVVCILSPNFVQRAEPSVADMHTRAEAAIACGTAVVIAMPTLYATANAEKFSEGAINIASSIKGIKWLAFGSECGNIDYIKAAAAVQASESAEFKASLKQLLASGITYAKALADTTAQFLSSNQYGNLNNNFLPPSSPNDILAIEYCKQLIKQGSSILPVTIKRQGAAHHDTTTHELYSSSSAIRTLLNSGNAESVVATMPSAAFAIFNKTWQTHSVDFKAFELLVLNSVRTKDLSLCPDSGEGLDIKLQKTAQKVFTLADLIEQTKSKRYTYGRIKRLCLQALLNITHYPTIDKLNLPARLLAVDKTIKNNLLPQCKKNIIIRNPDEQLYVDSLPKRKKDIVSYIIGVCQTANSIYGLLTSNDKLTKECGLIVY